MDLSEVKVKCVRVFTVAGDTGAMALILTAPDGTCRWMTEPELDDIALIMTPGIQVISGGGEVIGPDRAVVIPASQSDAFVTKQTDEGSS